MTCSDTAADRAIGAGEHFADSWLNTLHLLNEPTALALIGAGVVVIVVIAVAAGLAGREWIREKNRHADERNRWEDRLQAMAMTPRAENTDALLALSKATQHMAEESSRNMVEMVHSMSEIVIRQEKGNEQMTEIATHLATVADRIAKVADLVSAVVPCPYQQRTARKPLP